MVGGTEDRIGGGAVSWKHGDAHGECNRRERPSSVLNAHALAVFPQLFGALLSDFQGCVGHNQEEFFPTDTTGDVFTSNLRIEHGAQFAQNDVAGLVAVGIVEAFEVIDIQQNRAEVLARASGTAQLAFERLLHEPAVEESGKGIANGENAQSFAKLEI